MTDDPKPIIHPKAARLAVVACPYCGEQHVHAWASGIRVPGCAGPGQARGYILACEGTAGPADYWQSAPSTDEEWQAMIGRNVRALRKAQGLTQQQIADGAGIDITYAGATELGKRNVSMSVLARIASVLGVHPALLMERDTAVNIGVLQEAARSGHRVEVS